MSSLSRLKKNAEIYKFNETVKNFTPEQYMESVNGVRRQLEQQYNDQLDKMEKRFQHNTYNSTMNAIEVISTEMLYELAEQMNAFDEDCEVVDQIRDKLKEILQNAIDSVKNYNSYKNEKQSRKKYKEKIKKLEKIGIKVDWGD